MCWADIPQLSTRDRRCPVAWQQYWQQSRPDSTDSRPSASFQARADASSPAASDGSYPSSEASQERLVVTMREQQGDTSQYGGTGEILTWPQRPGPGHQEAGPLIIPGLPSLVALSVCVKASLVPPDRLVAFPPSHVGHGRGKNCS